MKTIPSIPIKAIKEARSRLQGKVLRTPLIYYKQNLIQAEIYLKPENLQPIGSFKIRGAGNALSLIPRNELKNGIYTASAGNMAQGIAWWAEKMEIPCTVLVPDHAPQTKLKAIGQLGAKYIKLPFPEWWDVLIKHEYPSMDGVFIHPVSNPAVIAGNATIGLEILEDMPDVDTIVVPFGGGGLSCGIASAIKSAKSKVRIYASEVETASPLAATLQAGKPVRVHYQPSFVDGIGSSSVLTEMWPLVKSLLNDSIVVSPGQIAHSIKSLMIKNRMIAEGAGASSLAAALTGKAGEGKIVCVISGGNIDENKIVEILEGRIPGLMG